MDETVTDRVRKVMDAASPSQAAFAERVGLTPDKLSKSLKGVRRFTSLDLARIAEVGGRTVDWLLTGRELLRPAFDARAVVEAVPGRGRVSDVAQRFTAAYDVLGLLGRLPELPDLPGVRGDIERYVDQGERLAADTLARLGAAGVTSVAELDTDALFSEFTRSLGPDIAVTALPDGVDGLTWQTDAFRLILLAPTQVWTRQRFTLAHELGHILARDAQDMVVESYVAPGRQKELTEVRANVFAAALLMPSHEVEEAFRAAGGGDGALTDDAFRRLVVRFKVSPSALAARLSRLGLISAEERDHCHRFTTETCHFLVGAADEYQRQQAWAAAEHFPSRIASALFQGYLEGETTLRPLAGLLGVDVGVLQEALDPEGDPAGPALKNDDVEEGDPVFQP